jgi:hypothetical protein
MTFSACCTVKLLFPDGFITTGAWWLSRCPSRRSYLAGNRIAVGWAAVGTNGTASRVLRSGMPLPGLRGKGPRSVFKPDRPLPSMEWS